MPILKRINGLYFSIHTVFLALVMIILTFWGVKNAYLYVLWAYALLGLGIKQLFSPHHRKGIRLYRKQQFESAIAEFEKSREYFSRHLIVDKLRCLTLLSLSKYTYREMALVNIAFCKTQIGKGAEAIELYREILDEFPNNHLAQSSLRMLESL